MVVEVNRILCLTACNFLRLSNNKTVFTGQAFDNLIPNADAESTDGTGSLNSVQQLFNHLKCEHEENRQKQNAAEASQPSTVPGK